MVLTVPKREKVHPTPLYETVRSIPDEEGERKTKDEKKQNDENSISIAGSNTADNECDKRDICEVYDTK